MTATHVISEAGLPAKSRPATATDLPRIAVIYNEGIAERSATFETTPRGVDDIADWLDGPFPCMVAEQGGSIVGWIHASRYRARECYAGIGDFSICLTRRARGQGIGDALMGAFLPACAEAGSWKLVARIFPENAASRALCVRHGFREVGTYERHGQLDGLWRDVVIVEWLV